MEVFVSDPFVRFHILSFPEGSAVGDLLEHFTQQKGASSVDFYVSRNGRLSDPEDSLQRGAVYHLEPRLCGGKGGFGSMLRALGAQIEKTTNREACRDLSGRRLRDVNHEKEMADWLKKQAEREAEKEQRRLERLQRKLAEPKHQFTDTDYEQQCHDLSERLEDSVLKGLQASCGGAAKVEEGAAKRPNSDQSEQPAKKKQKTLHLWMGVGELDSMMSSEEEEEEEEEELPSTSSAASSCTNPVVIVTHKQEEKRQKQEVEPEQNMTDASTQSSSVSPASDCSSTSDQIVRSSEEQKPPQTSTGSTESSCSPQQQQDQRESGLGGVRVDLDSVASAKELEELSLDVLKEELASRGLKCGGTLTERAARLFSVRGLAAEQIDPALLTKAGKGKRK
ncbi:hypothetical protein LDENG_00179410 [Lucifuga dentata]|nr:hypothetical protein LDENG_00179410 [Lucifuga dentata]